MIHQGTLVLTLLSWWRIGQGRGEGGTLDDAVLRSPEGLPWIPGTAVKGLAREAVTQLAAYGGCGAEHITALFGDQAPEREKEDRQGHYARFETTPGKARFAAAEMSEAWRDWARTARQRETIDALFDSRAMTAVETRGGAKTGTLRMIEVAAPMTLRAPVQAAPMQAAPALAAALVALEQAAPLIRSLGMGRNRGFGRVSVVFERTSQGRDAR